MTFLGTPSMKDRTGIYPGEGEEKFALEQLKHCKKSTSEIFGKLAYYLYFSLEEKGTSWIVSLA